MTGPMTGPMTGSTTEPIPRTAVRVVMLDPADRVLLIELHDRADGTRWWVMPGGGVDPGESDEAAARREVLEETGLRDIELGPLIWQRHHVFEWRGLTYDQRERFYLARVEAFTPAFTQLADDEAELVQGMRWWSVDELEAAPDEFAPRALGRLLRELLEAGAPVELVDTGV